MASGQQDDATCGKSAGWRLMSREHGCIRGQRINNCDISKNNSIVAVCIRTSVFNRAHSHPLHSVHSVSLFDNELCPRLMPTWLRNIVPNTTSSFAYSKPLRPVAISTTTLRILLCLLRHRAQPTHLGFLLTRNLLPLSRPLSSVAPCPATTSWLFVWFSSPLFISGPSLSLTHVEASTI